MIAATELRLVLVTPEKTLVDTPVRGMRFPLFDGQFGVLPGRAPAIGRLGQGELSFDSPTGTERYYIESGFMQIKGGVVTLLTSRAIPAEEIQVAVAEQELTAALALKPNTEIGFEEKRVAVERARQMLAMRRRA